MAESLGSAVSRWCPASHAKSAPSPLRWESHLLMPRDVHEMTWLREWPSSTAPWWKSRALPYSSGIYFDSRCSHQEIDGLNKGNNPEKYWSFFFFKQNMIPVIEKNQVAKRQNISDWMSHRTCRTWVTPGFGVNSGDQENGGVEIWKACLFLLHSDASWMTGEEVGL